MPVAADLCADLALERASLDSVVAGLDRAGWHRQTPAAGWDVLDCVSHLCFFDELATVALRDPDAFELQKTELLDQMGAGATVDVDLGRASEPGALLERWRASRQAFVDAALEVPDKQRVPWFGPPMSVTSFITARLMETWAHGVDVRDALGQPTEESARLRHVVHLGVSARPFSFAVHGLSDPGDPVRVEATTRDGSVWTWGPTDALNRIEGDALELALVFTQRRHRSRTGVKATGAVAEEWLAVAQAFAGPPTLTAVDR